MHGGPLDRGVVRTEVQREQEQPDDVRERRERREPHGDRALALEHRRHRLPPRVRVEHRPAHGAVGRPHQRPARHERRHLAPLRPADPEEPGPNDEGRRHDCVLLAEEPERERRGTPDDALPLQGGVEREQRETGRHELVSSHDVRHGLHVHGVDGEQHARREARLPPRPAPRQHGDGHARPRMPQHVDRVEPDRPVQQPVECEAGDGERPVQCAREVPRPIRLRERAPPRARLAHERVEHDDVHVVEGERVPQGAGIDDESASGDREIHAPRMHGAPGAAPGRPARRGQP